jgi:DNA ligase-associated metallophosphoesterase
MAGLKVMVAGEELVLLPERAAFWPAKGWLICADLHWGKAETFQHFGLPVPSAVLNRDLERLATCALGLGAGRILVLGDLIHARVGLSDGVRASVAEFFQRTKIPMTLVRGNHDRSLRKIPEDWNLEVVEDFLDAGPFRFRHDDGPRENQYQWLGHVHPLWVMRTGGDRVRLPCFWMQKHAMTLPAFSAFTAGIVVTARPGDRVFGLTEDEVLELPTGPRAQTLPRNQK